MALFAARFIRKTYSWKNTRTNNQSPPLNRFNAFWPYPRIDRGHVIYRPSRPTLCGTCLSSNDSFLLGLIGLCYVLRKIIKKAATSSVLLVRAEFKTLGIVVMISSLLFVADPFTVAATYIFSELHFSNSKKMKPALFASLATATIAFLIFDVLISVPWPAPPFLPLP